MAEQGTRSSSWGAKAATPASWRGKQSRRVQDVQYGWQTERSRRHEQGERVRDRAGILWLFFWTTVFLLGSGWLCVILLRVPEQTPFVAITSPTYRWPLPPNDWSADDLDKLSNQLAGQSLAVIDTSASWEAKDRGLRILEQRLDELAARPQRSDAIILYISMHGVVDGEGRPCFIPPGGSPWNSDSWVSLAEVFDLIAAAQLPDQLQKVVVIDANRLQVHWEVGLLYNTLADGLADAVDEAGIPNLVVLNSTRPDELGWASTDLQSSVFGHFFRLGIAGAADDRGEGGDGDHWVSLHEMHRYLTHHVDDWTWQNRGAHQQPLLYPLATKDARLARVLVGGSALPLADPDENVDDALAVSQEDIAQLWRDRETMRQLEAVRFDPAAWHRFESKLLWLEHAVEAGRGYLDASSQMYKELRDTADGVLPDGDDSPAAASVLARSGLFGRRLIRSNDVLKVHTLPMAQYFGKVEAANVAEFDAALTLFQAAPTAEQVSGMLAQWSAREPDSLYLQPHVLELIGKYAPNSAWEQGEVVSLAVEALAKSTLASVADDERSLAWARPLVETGDARLRVGLDRLFVGTDAALAEARTALADADQQFDIALARCSGDVGLALKSRDVVLAETPYLARWLARPIPGNADPAEADGLINEQLLPLIERTRTSDLAITLGPGGDAANDSSLAVAVKQMRQRFGELKAAYFDRCGKLNSEDQPTVEMFAPMAAALRMPVLDAAGDDDADRADIPPFGVVEREQFKRKLRQLATDLHNAYRPAPAVNSSKSAPPSAATVDNPAIDDPAAVDTVGYVERATRVWAEHPLMALLANGGDETLADTLQPIVDDQDGGGGPTGLAGTGEQARQQYTRRMRRLEDLAEQFIGGAGDATVDELRGRLARADYQFRELGGWWYPEGEDDPVSMRRRFDLQELLLWHAQRALDDFWGGNDGEAFFDVATSDYLDAAQAFVSPSAASSNQIKHTRELLALRRRAASHALRAMADDAVMIQPLDQVETRLSLIADSSADDLPEGEAAVFLADGNGRITGSNQALDLPLGKEDHDVVFPFQIEHALVAGRGPTLDALAWYRGHRFAAEWDLGLVGGALVEVKRQQTGPPRVTLYGGGGRHASIVFVLDCSHSMADLTMLEGPGEYPAVTRLDAAKAALRTMLDRWADVDDARVGVMLYGHRVGWNVEQPTELLRQTEYARQIPSGLRPSEDVEWVKRLGRFDENVAAEVESTLSGVKPWGESPLYLSLTNALEAFVAEDDDRDKSIIVVTDGVNYQFNSPDPKTQENVFAAWAGRSVPIHIVGFDVPDEEAFDAFAAFNALAAQTGGSYVPAESAAELMTTLEAHLGTAQFRVRDTAQQVVAKAAIGAPAVLENAVLPGTFTVELETMRLPIQLDGGEAIELSVDRAERRLVLLPYLQGDPKFHGLVDLRGSESSVAVGIHRSWAGEGTVRFPISLQDRERRFVPRPGELWIEITPHSEAVSASTYVFYDRNFVQNQRVPLVECTAGGWPKGVREAEIRLWSQDRSIPADKVLTVGDFLADPAGVRSVEGFNGVTFQLHVPSVTEPNAPVQVVIIERHDHVESAGDQNWGDLPLVKIVPAPRSAMHRFDRERRLVTHRFEFDSAVAAAVDSLEVHFTKGARVKSGAWSLAKPVLVDVAADDDVLKPGPTLEVPENQR